MSSIVSNLFGFTSLCISLTITHVDKHEYRQPFLTQVLFLTSCTAFLAMTTY